MLNMHGTVADALRKIEVLGGKDVRIVFDDITKDRIPKTIRQIWYSDAIREHIRDNSLKAAMDFLNARCVGILDYPDFEMIVVDGLTGYFDQQEEKDGTRNRRCRVEG